LLREEREKAERRCSPGNFCSVSGPGRELRAEKPALVFSSFCAQGKRCSCVLVNKPGCIKAIAASISSFPSRSGKKPKGS